MSQSKHGSVEIHINKNWIEQNGQQIGSLEQQNEIWMAQSEYECIQTKMQINFLKLTSGQ